MYSDIAICVVMYVVADRMLKHGSSIKVGFRFNDQSIQRKYVSLSVAYRVVIYGTSVAVMALMYAVNHFYGKKQVYNLYWKYMFGWLCIANVNMFVKSFVGRLRPNFLSMNRVGKDFVTAEGFSEDHVLPEVKSATDKLMAMESRKSFFSGHAAMGMYAASFVCLWANDALAMNVVVVVFQVISLMTGMYPGLTQWRNYWHHWDDVAVGYFLGAVSAFLTYFYVYHDEESLLE